MSIEVISVPDRRRIRLRLVPVCVVLLLAMFAFAGDALVRSYTYYSQIIDARLAGGYLTSRPGLYAAPRVLQVGQKFSVEKLVATLRRAAIWSRRRVVFGVGVLLRMTPWWRSGLTGTSFVWCA